ncbi:unnamed protein product [Clonostachys rosea]|uniref:Uncharacterized protein n=1 Tax=Bionectria ochroleuca TaxID=29856 RepID=A0ABY6UEA3_BIOOC|nr:unnamed protein product [Clonostachys rosea]
MAVNPERPGPGEQVDREAAESVATRLEQLSSLQPSEFPATLCWYAVGVGPVVVRSGGVESVRSVDWQHEAICSWRVSTIIRGTGRALG